jgi:sporulation protein YlmC with PRC-barrel domain
MMATNRLPRADEERNSTLWRAHELEGYSISARDGDVGHVYDFFFDGQSWTVRHIVVDTGTWLSGRRVLISPRAIVRVDPSRTTFECALTRAQVEGSPDVDTDLPVSRQREIELATYYNYPDYWGGPLRWGTTEMPAVPYPAAPLPLHPPVGSASVAEEVRARARESGDPHLHSARKVRGYSIRATDGDLGHVEDFLIDDVAWAIRYLVVDPRNWWPGNHVVISPEWITDVNWDDSVVGVNVDRASIRNAPVYDPEVVNREWETQYHRSLGRPGYWDRNPETWMF